MTANRALNVTIVSNILQINGEAVATLNAGDDSVLAWDATNGADARTRAFVIGYLKLETRGATLLAALREAGTSAFEHTLPASAAVGQLAKAPVFSWEPHPNAATYTLEVDDDPAFGSSVSVTAIATTSYTWGAGAEVQLLGSTAYYWRVTAVAADGSIARTPSRTMTTGVLPAVFAHVTPADDAAAVSVTPTFDWEDSAGADTFRLEVALDNAFTTGLVTVAGIVASTYVWGTGVEADLTALTEYYWRVYAVNAIGERRTTAAEFHLTTA